MRGHGGGSRSACQSSWGPPRGCVARQLAPVQGDRGAGGLSIPRLSHACPARPHRRFEALATVVIWLSDRRLRRGANDLSPADQEVPPTSPAAPGELLDVREPAPGGREPAAAPCVATTAADEDEAWVSPTTFEDVQLTPKLPEEPAEPKVPPTLAMAPAP